MKHPTRQDSPAPHIGAWPNLIGLDSPFVAVCWQAMFAKISGADLPWFIHLILGLSTWCIYLADRILDVTRIDHQAGTSRHRFTQIHLRKLIYLLIFVSIGNLVMMIRFLPHQLWISGLITLGLIVIYYLVRLTRLKNFITLIPREVMCGMLFALGCSIAPYAYASSPWLNQPTLFIPAFMFGCVCSASCILISSWESEADILTADPSIITTHAHFLPYLAKSLLCLTAITLTFSLFIHWQAFLSIGISAILLLVALDRQSQISPLNRRILADAFLLSPLIFIGF